MDVQLPLLWSDEFKGLQEKAEERRIALGSTAAFLDLFLCQKGICRVYERQVLQQSHQCSQSCPWRGIPA